MSLSIHTNYAALVTQNSLNKFNSALTTTQQRLGTGLRINSAADDAAGLQIATRLNANARGMAVAMRNTSDAVSLLQTGEGAFQEMTDILQRMKDLATQAASDTNSAADRSAMEAEFTELAAEISNILQNTKYAGEALFTQGGTGGTTTVEIGGKHYLASNNGSEVLVKAAGGGYEWADWTAITAEQIQDGDLLEVAQGTSYELGADPTTHLVGKDGAEVAMADLANAYALNGIAQVQGDGKLMQEFNLQIGASSSETLTLDLSSDIGDLYTAISTATTGSLQDHDDAKLVMNALEAAIDAIGVVRSGFGANINRLNHTANNLANMRDNTEMARGRIMDADFAVESANMSKNSMLMQSGISMLRQASQMPSLVMSLLG